MLVSTRSPTRRLSVPVVIETCLGLQDLFLISWSAKNEKNQEDLKLAKENFKLLNEDLKLGSLKASKFFSIFRILRKFQTFFVGFVQESFGILVSKRSPTRRLRVSVTVDTSLDLQYVVLISCSVKNEKPKRTSNLQKRPSNFQMRTSNLEV